LGSEAVAGRCLNKTFIQVNGSKEKMDAWGPTKKLMSTRSIRCNSTNHFLIAALSTR